MTFESLLSRRYIFAQKRHSLLTISSIAVAVTLMTFLFCAFTTYINCIAKGAPYHIRLDSATAELVEYVKDYPGVKESYSEKQSDGTYEIRVFFDKNIVNPFEMIRDIEVLQEKEPDRLKLDPDKFSFKDNFVYMAFDMIGDSGKTAMVQYVALFYIVILFLAFALRLIIDTSFEVSAKEREKQFGVLQSIGASPKQIVGIISRESKKRDFRASDPLAGRKGADIHFRLKYVFQRDPCSDKTTVCVCVCIKDLLRRLMAFIRQSHINTGTFIAGC